MYELFDHTADLGLRVRAATLAELLTDAGRGLLAMQVANPESVRPVEARTIEFSADEPGYLLFDWLSELLYVFESDKLLLAQYELEIVEGSGGPERPNGTASSASSSVSLGHGKADASRSPMAFPVFLTAICRGEPMDAARHVMDHEVKAITYHGLRVEEHDGTWFAEVIVDI